MAISYVICPSENNTDKLTRVEFEALLPDEKTNIGFIVLKPIEEAELLLDDLFVEKPYRNQGVGEDLLNTAIKEICKGHNYSSVIVFLQTANYESAEDALSRETQQRIMGSLGFIECKDDSDASNNIIAMKKILGGISYES